MVCIHKLIWANTFEDGEMSRVKICLTWLTALLWFS